MINSFGGEQDNVVFLGRRSFRMELVRKLGGDELRVPQRASEIPTERIFDSDRKNAVRAALSSPRPAQGISSATSIGLSLATFALGIGLTLTFHRGEPRRPVALAPSVPAQVAAPAPAVPAVPPLVVQMLPATPSEAIDTRPPARRPLARPARAARPRPARAPRSVAPAPAPAPAATPWVDPFAE